MPKKSKKAAEASEAANGPSTGTGAEAKEKPETKVKEEVKVHTGLATLLGKLDEATEKAGSYLVETLELIVRDSISNPVLIKTIMETRGIKEASAKSQASRMRSMLKDEETFKALKAGEVTVRAAVKGAQARRVASPESKAKAFDKALNKFVEAAKASGQDRKTILVTVEAALDKAKIK